MCRLFFSFRNKSVKPLLEEFLAQSTHKTKNTPHLDNYRDLITHTDGFGIAWKRDEKDCDADMTNNVVSNELETSIWKIYKQPKVYSKDPNLDAVLDTIPNSLVIAHIRKKPDGKKSSMKNTHPFHYNGQIFAHNGVIDEFEKHIPLLKSYIYRPLLREIQGETDTEFLFFLFLSCKKYLEQRKGKPRLYSDKNTTRKSSSKKPEFSKSQIKLYENIISRIKIQSIETSNYIYINAFTLLTGIFIEHSIELVANVVYANSNIVLLTRYIFYDKAKYDEPQIPMSLYWNKCKTYGDNGILITSEPLSKYDSVLFPENSIAILDYIKYELTIHKIE
jgi:predicted glutamine amidotransferase